MLKLFIQSLAGLLFLLGVLALALFWSAGTIDFWQAWLYLAVFVACVILITGYLIACDRRLLQSRLNVGPVAETRRSQQAIHGLASLFFLALYVFFGAGSPHGVVARAAVDQMSMLEQLGFGPNGH